jgi:hypothetical protein
VRSQVTERLSGPALWLQAARSWSCGLGMSDPEIMRQLQSVRMGFGLTVAAALAVVSEMRQQLDAEGAARAAAEPARLAALAVRNAERAARQQAAEAQAKAMGLKPSTEERESAWGSTPSDGWRVD